MASSAPLVERLRPLLAKHTLGEQLYVVALLESRSAQRYREWAEQVSDPGLADGLRACAQREDDIANRIRARFAGIVTQPRDFAYLAPKIQAEVIDVFGGHSREDQFFIQAQAERGGEQLWNDLAAQETDAGTKRVLLECAALEAESARYLEGLPR